MRYAEDAAWREREQARQRAKFQSQSREQRARHRKQKTEWQRRHAPIPFSLEFRWLAAHRATLSPPAATAKQPLDLRTKCGHAHLAGAACPRGCARCQKPFPHPTRQHLCATCRRPRRDNYRIPLERLWRRDQGTCGICGEPVPPPSQFDHRNIDPLYPTRDHIIPVAHGGQDVAHNLRLAHWKCNTQRGATWLTEQQRFTI